MTQNSYLSKLAYLSKLDKARQATQDKQDVSSLTLPDINDWLQGYYYLPETRRPIQLQWHQKDILTEFTRRTPNGHFVWTTLLYSTIKKSGKTALNGGYCQWAAENWGHFQEVYTTGNKLEQAQERAFAKVIMSLTLSRRGSRKENDDVPWYIQATKLTHKPTGSFIKAIPIADEGEAGANQSLTSWTELWGYTHEASTRFWEEMQPVLTRPLSQRFVDTYAGYTNESDLLWSIWELGLTGEKLHPDLPLYGVKDAGLCAYIDTGLEARRMSWQLGELGAKYYTQAELSERPHNYRRLHLNEWVESINALVEMPIWDALALDTMPKVNWVVIAIDASRTNDCTALCVVSRIGDITYILETWIWTPSPEHEMDYQLTVVPAIEHIMQRYTVAKIAYDPWQLEDTMLQMSKQYRRIPFEAFKQDTPRLEADTAFVAKINQGQIRHNGDLGLREHIQNADGKENVDKDTIRIVKRTADKKIDAAVAASMGVQVAGEIANTYRAPARFRATLKDSTRQW